MWNGKSCRLLCLPFWSRPLRNAPIRQAIVGECRSTTPSIGPRKMIHGKMLSWQLASLMMAHSLNMAITLGGSILRCGKLVASSPKKLSNQIPVPPPFVSRLTAETHRPSLVHQSFSWQGSGRGSGKSMVVVSAQQAKLPGEILKRF
jgi:hypothetical protein